MMLTHISTLRRFTLFMLFFFNDTATTEIYTLSLHDALPIFRVRVCTVHAHLLRHPDARALAGALVARVQVLLGNRRHRRSEEHTSELQSQSNLVCRLLLEKKKKKNRKTGRLITATPVKAGLA